MACRIPPNGILAAGPIGKCVHDARYTSFWSAATRRRSGGRGLVRAGEFIILVILSSCRLLANASSLLFVDTRREDAGRGGQRTIPLPIIPLPLRRSTHVYVILHSVYSPALSRNIREIPAYFSLFRLFQHNKWFFTEFRGKRRGF
jgi:hypothetical protein